MNVNKSFSYLLFLEVFLHNLPDGNTLNSLAHTILFFPAAALSIKCTCVTVFMMTVHILMRLYAYPTAHTHTHNRYIKLQREKSIKMVFKHEKFN